MSHRIYSAVVDSHGVYPMQAQRLLWSLTRLAHVEPQDILFHVVGTGDHPDILQSLRTAGAGVVHIAPNPLDVHPWCRKLRQLESLAQRDFTDVVLLDCDVIVLEPPPPARGCALGKPVDFGNPRLANLERIFLAAGLPIATSSADIDGAPTVRGNANGGVYVIARDVFAPLATAWVRWAAWCLENPEPFGDHWMHIDQVAFAMAIAAAEIPFQELHRRYNVPTHVSQARRLDCEPAILHYHTALDTQQFLLPVDDLPLVNASIQRVNTQLLQDRQSGFDNAAFWNARYAMHPELGSGAGSRGETLSQKQQLLSHLVAILRPESLLDIAGGDGETIKSLPDGVAIEATDIAAAARDRYVAAVPRARWFQHDIRTGPVPSRADLHLCLDLLIHIVDKQEYGAIVRNLCIPGAALVVSGFDAAPVEPGPMTWFHEPLSLTLTRMGRVPIPIASYRGLTVFFCPRSEGTRAARDAREETLRAALPLVSQPLVLIEAIALSRDELGFFPDHLPRMIEYPWVISQLAGRSCLRILDAGAGVSVLPLLLADRGHRVITADPHLCVRNGTPRESWDEWGFLDYAAFRPAIQSLHTAYQTTDPCMKLDALVSVSVIEHLTREVRLNWLAQARRQIVPGGLLILTVDTVPFSNALWNYSEGRVVEDPGAHGTLPQLVREVADCGFTIEVLEHSPWLPQSRVGMARIRATRNAE
jgi:hypothetical protein